MTVSTTYLIRVLRGVEEKFEADGRHQEASLISRIAADLSSSPDTQMELDKLFDSDGMEQLALGLMWVMTRDRSGLNGHRQEVIAYDVEELSRMVVEIDDPEEQGDPGDPYPLRSVLPDFSRAVADLGRRVYANGRFKGITEDLLWRFKSEVETLRLSAVREANADVVGFCDGLDLFLGYALEHQVFQDVRVIGVINNANLTLQTIVGGGIPEDRRPLDQMIELLRRPSLFFEQNTGTK